jgi:hypothetical protein
VLSTKILRRANGVLHERITVITESIINGRVSGIRKEMSMKPMHRCYKLNSCRVTHQTHSQRQSVRYKLHHTYSRELLSMNRTQSQRLVQTRTRHKGNTSATHIEADRPYRLALTTTTHASLNPRGKIASETAGTARRRVSQSPCVHERPPYVYITRTNGKRREGRGGEIRSKG